jgi:hypothetical protein
MAAIIERDLSTSTVDGLTPAVEPVVSWSAIFAGAVVALAVSIFLTVLAAGFGMTFGFGGLATRDSLSTFTPELGAGAIAIQVVSAALGGYLAGRLRHAWLGAHTDEAHFRDTAHGLIAWAVSMLAGIVLAAMVLAPYAEQLAAATAVVPPTARSAVEAVRAANIAVQSALFGAVGMLLSAFAAAVAGRVGGLRSEEMHAKAWTAAARPVQPARPSTV